MCNNNNRCSCPRGLTGSTCQNRPGTNIIFLNTIPILTFVIIYTLCSVINECTLGLDNCDHVCTDTHDSFNCSCRPGYALAADNHTCSIDCGGRLTAVSGSFHTPGWPNSYPYKRFRCEWIIDVPGTNSIEFTIDPSRFGTLGNPSSSCTSDNIQFFDGVSNRATSLSKLCGLASHYNGGLPVITTSSSSAKVVFTSVSTSRPVSRVGVKVDYQAGGMLDLVYTPLSFLISISFLALLK